MTNNERLRRLRYALHLNFTAVEKILRLAGHDVSGPTVAGLLKKEEEEGFIVCTDQVLNAFLDGLIIQNRGKKEDGAVPADIPVPQLTNNEVLRKLRIALSMRDTDMIEVFRSAGVAVSKSELSALFRDRAHRNYKACGDQLLRNFINGLALRFRPADPGSPAP